jgi:hypothetical protein
LTLVAFSIWAALGITRPLTDFANAVESFSLNATPAEIEEAGSEEVRIAARAFNRMQRRIKEMVDKRTRMLVAVSHDLRTPITRMPLPAEFISSGMQKRRRRSCVISTKCPRWFARVLPIFATGHGRSCCVGHDLAPRSDTDIDNGNTYVAAPAALTRTRTCQSL